MIGLKLEVKSQVAAKKFRLPKKVLADLDLYVEAAREAEPTVDHNAVLQAILQHHLSKDRAFQDWLKSRQQGERRMQSAATTPRAAVSAPAPGPQRDPSETTDPGSTAPASAPRVDG